MSAERSERGGAASGVKWPHGEPASPSERVAHSADPPLPRNERTETRLPSPVFCPHLSDEPGPSTEGVYSQSSARPPHSVAPLAVKCNCGLCGIKTALTHNHRRSETRTNARRRRDRSGERKQR